MSDTRPTRGIDTNRPHSARMYDYYLGGKDHFEVDAQAAEQVASAYASIFTCARENRSFMHRATRVLAREHGIRQWLDIGTGIPTEPNLHQVAQSVAPDARVVYADNDPLVLKYAERLMRSTSEGRTTYIEADVNDPESLLDSAEFAELLDLDRPVALSLNALLHFVTDAQDPHRIVRTLLGALPSGSALAISHCTPEFDPESWEKVEAIYTGSGTPVQFRTHKEVASFFEGLDLLEPGVVVGHRWRPDAVGETTVAEAAGTEAAGTGDPAAGGPGAANPGAGNPGATAKELTDAEVSLWVGVGIKP